MENSGSAMWPIILFPVEPPRTPPFRTISERDRNGDLGMSPQSNRTSTCGMAAQIGRMGDNCKPWRSKHAAIAGEDARSILGRRALRKADARIRLGARKTAPRETREDESPKQPPDAPASTAGQSTRWRIWIRLAANRRSLVQTTTPYPSEISTMTRGRIQDGVGPGASDVLEQRHARRGLQGPAQGCVKHVAARQAHLDLSAAA